MNARINIKVGDFIFNKEDIKKGNSTILFRADEVEDRILRKWDYEKGKEGEPYAAETLVTAYCFATDHRYYLSVRHDKDEWGVISAETMKVLCA